MNTLEGLLLEKNLMPYALAPLLSLWDLFALCLSSSRVWRAWSRNRHTRDDWQKLLRIREAVAWRFGWHFGDHANVLRLTLERVGYARIFPKSIHDRRHEWWCMGGCGTKAITILVAAHLLADGRRMCCECYGLKYNVMIGQDAIRSWHAIICKRRAHLLEYTPENNRHMFPVFMFRESHHRLDCYGIHIQDIGKTN